jgi:epoxyqueuosine reductase
MKSVLSEILSSEKLSRFGISEWGYTEDSKANFYDQYSRWIDEEKHLPLKYLEGERGQKRKDLKLYFNDFNSSLVFIFDYHESKFLLEDFYKTSESNGLKIASYTLGFKGYDYHLIIRNSLIEIGEELKKAFKGLEYQLSLDVHPVMERDLAYRSGLGWQGKNSMFLTRKSGSFFIIGSLLLNKKLEIDKKKLDTDHCGQCTRCIDACPTNAIETESRTIMAKDCISTFTIEEFKLETIPSEKMNLSSGYIFGCDICQDVCPWNIKIQKKIHSMTHMNFNEQQHKIVNFFLRSNPKNIVDELKLMSQKTFKIFFNDSSFFRSGKRGILKNIYFYLNRS